MTRVPAAPGSKGRAQGASAGSFILHGTRLINTLVPLTAVRA